MKHTLPETMLDIPFEVLAAHNAFVVSGRDGSLTIHYGKGQPRKIERKEFESIESLGA